MRKQIVGVAGAAALTAGLVAGAPAADAAPAGKVWFTFELVSTSVAPSRPSQRMTPTKPTAKPKPKPKPKPPARPATPQAIARSMLSGYGWNAGTQFPCLNNLWTKESRWNVHASNPSSGAYGIPQAVPGSKMASAGPDWRNNATTQVKWGLSYTKGRYGSPCAAWTHSQQTGWY